MATTKITDLTAYTDPINTDVLPIVDVTNDVTKKVSIANVMKNASLGSAAAPGISFDGDPNTGIYSPGANQVAVSTDGTARLTASTTAITAAIPVDVLLGSASTPSYTFTGDLNTGIYSPGADQVAISTNGTGRLFINSSGQVGVGTSSPGVILDIRETATGATTAISLFNTDNTNSTSQTARIGLSPDSRGAALTGLEAYKENSDFSTSAARDVSLALNVLLNNAKSEAVRITSAGLVGIGTSAPASLLHVQGTSGTYPTTIINHSLINTEGEIIRIGRTDQPTRYHSIYAQQSDAVTSSYLQFRVHSGGSTSPFTQQTTVMTLNGAGRVGIGTGSPSVTFEVASAADNTEYMRVGSISSASSRSLRFSTEASSGGTANTTHIINAPSTAGFLKFQTNSTTAVTIDASQRVGIGSTSPTQALEVAGSIRLNNDLLYADATATRGRIYGDSTGLVVRADTGLALRFHADAGEKARIDTSGRLLVGTSSSTSVGNINGGIQLAGSVPSISVAGFTNTVSGGYLVLGKSRGTTVGTVVQSNDVLGEIRFAGDDGTDLITLGASITGQVDGTPGVDDMPGRLVFSTTADGASSPTERMRINAVGQVNTYSTDSSLILRNSNTSGTTYAFLAGIYSATSATTGGTVSFRVYTNGDVQNTNNSYGAISDIKLKENIVDANSQWDDLKALQVRKYNFKEGQTHTQIGLVAQEVELVSPGLVTESPDRDAEGNDLGTVTKSVNYSVLYMKAVKALQEAMERIELLEARLDAANL